MSPQKRKACTKNRRRHRSTLLLCTPSTASTTPVSHLNHHLPTWVLWSPSVITMTTQMTSAQCRPSCGQLHGCYCRLCTPLLVLQQLLLLSCCWNVKQQTLCSTACLMLTRTAHPHTHPPNATHCTDLREDNDTAASAIAETIHPVCAKLRNVDLQSTAQVCVHIVTHSTVLTHHALQLAKQTTLLEKRGHTPWLAYSSSARHYASST